MLRFFLAVLSILPIAPSLWAEGKTPVSASTHPPITTRWTTLGGMQYWQRDKALSGPELKSAIDSIGDPQASALLSKSESDETLGFIGLGGSAGLSLLSLFFPNTHIHVIGLDISTPYLPIAVPGAVLGVAGGLLVLESNTAKYTAVQRYNRVTRQPESVTMNLAPEKKGLGLNVVYRF